MPFHPKNVSRSVLILHGREEDDLADVVLLAKEHAEAVNAAADAACRRHAVIQGVDEAEVDVSGFLISPFPGGRGCVRDTLEKVMREQGRWKFDVGCYKNKF